MVTGIGHTVVGLILFREPLAAMVRQGVANTIHYGQFDRAAAFWFLLFSPICFALGQIVAHAIERNDARTLRLIGWYLLAMGVVGATVMPISGFWIVIVIAPLILRGASDAAVTADVSTPWRASQV
jgi:hypothetical protein